MTKLLIFSDPHITDAGETIIGLDTLDRFETTLDAALASHPDAAALVLLGDLAHHGTVEAYARLQDAVASVSIPVIPLLGNHDRRHHFLQVFSDAPQTPHGFVQTSNAFGKHQLITLDTLDGPPYPPGHHSGWLCEDRLAWLDAELAAAKDKQVIVALHHPPIVTGIVGMDAIRLRNGPELLDRLQRHGAATLLCGHLHRTVSGVTRGVPWTIFKSTGHQGPLDLHDPDSSLSVDEPPAFGVVLLQEDGVVIHSQDILDIGPPAQDPRSQSH